jgi:two-component system OmpR family sensor kinase
MSDSSAYYAANPPVAPAAQAWTPPDEVLRTEAPRRRWRFVPRSLSGRLVAGVVALVALVVVATGAATYYTMRSYLYDRLDQQVQSISSDPQSVNRLLNRMPNLVAGFQVPQTVWVAVLTPSGQPVTSFELPSGPELAELDLSAADRARLAKGTSSPVTRTTLDGQEVRVRAIANLDLRSSDAVAGTVTDQPVTVLIGLSTADVHRTLARLVGLELLIGSAAVVIALVATGYGVRFSLRRLRGVTATAQEVAAELSPEGAGLQRRVPVAETEEGTEVGQLAESMNTLLSAVETQFAARLESEHRMRQFLADASHELRTPLTSIRGYAELARMRGENAADDLARIEAEGTRMSRLVDDLLTLTRSDQSDAHPQPQLVDIAEVLEDVVDGARAAFPQRRIDLTTAHGLNVVGDPDQLVRVVRNLVTNAAVHTDPAGPIAVLAERDGANVVVRVADKGPGLPPEEAEHVFERFWRADRARTRARGGSGLGMSIVASLVRANGGTVRFDSSVADGSTVTVRLPAATP